MNKDARNSGQQPPTSQPAKPERDRAHRFIRGHKKRGGRRKGTPNVMSPALKAAIICAAECLGEDDRGKNGLVGYLMSLAKGSVSLAKGRTAPEFAGLLRRILPLQTTSEIDAAKRCETVEEVTAALRTLGLPLYHLEYRDRSRGNGGRLKPKLWMSQTDCS